MTGDVIHRRGMSTMSTSVFLLGILLTIPARGVASTSWSDPPPATTRVATALAATHATTGVVESVDATSLVITRSALTRKNMAFVLNSATEREGHLAVGSRVEVRYRTDEKQQVATAVRVQEHQPPASAGKSSPRY
jgi:hypothetical protein